MQGTGAQAGPRVLVVGGNPDDVEILRRQLYRNGYAQVARVETPEDAVALLWPEAPDPAPLDVPLDVPLDALLLDAGLPVLEDGRSLLQHVRRSPRWHRLPVLVLVGRQPPSLIRAAVQEGASGFIQRPFDGLEVIYKMEQALRGASRAVELSDLARNDTD